MAGLEGTVKLPGFGPVQKKTVLYGTAAVVALGVVVAYRHKNSAAATPTDTTNAEIDPATGFAYGSPEDLAALQAQGNYTLPTPSGGGGSSIPNGGTGYATNGAWSQGVIDYMLHNGLVEDPTALSAALGVYLTGSYATDAQIALIQQAIAVQGYPPVSGSTGYPPSINRNPPQGGKDTPPPANNPPPVNNDPTLPAPTGLHVTSVDQHGASLDWDPVPGAIGYKTYIGKTQVGNTVTYSNAYVYNLKPGTKYSVIVYPVNKSNRNGWWSTVTFTTKK